MKRWFVFLIIFSAKSILLGQVNYINCDSIKMLIAGSGYLRTNFNYRVYPVYKTDNKDTDSSRSVRLWDICDSIPDGKWAIVFKDDTTRLFARFNVQDGFLQDSAYVYYYSGEVKAIYIYNHGRWNGKNISYGIDGTVSSIDHWKNGYQHGIFKLYNKENKLTDKARYKKGKAVYSISYTCSFWSKCWYSSWWQKTSYRNFSIKRTYPNPPPDYIRANSKPLSPVR